MKILISGEQYRELVHMIALEGFSEAVLEYWNNEFDKLSQSKVKLSKNTANMLQKFVVSLNNTLLNEKEKYVALVTSIAKENNYEINEKTEVQLADDELAIILQQIADTKENE